MAEELSLIQPADAPIPCEIFGLGSGLRWTIDQMGPEAAARVMDDNIGWLTENNVLGFLHGGKALEAAHHALVDGV